MARNPALEAAILAAPDDEQGYLVYADWLQQQGDPRGELGALQASHQRELLARYRAGFLGGLPDPGDPRDERALFLCTWRGGWMVEARLREHEMATPIALYPALVACESARLLTALHFDVVDDHAELRRQILGHGVPWRLRELRVPTGLQRGLNGSVRLHDDTDLGDFGAILRLVPGLRVLDLHGDRITLDQLDLPELAELHLEMTRLSADSVRALAHSRWPKLRRLHIDTREVAADALVELLASPNFPVLEDLTLSHCATGELVAPLLASPMLPHLRRLALPLGRLGPQDLRRLYLGRAALAGLELVLVGNPLGEDPAGLAGKLAVRRA